MASGTLSGTLGLTCPILALCLLLLPACGGSQGREGASNGNSAAPAGEDRVRATVTEVVDGDTVYVSPAIGGEESVRMIGVDVPEKAGSPRGEQPLGEEALVFAQERLTGREVELEFDEERVDDYGRNLAYLYVGGELFNEALLREGFAQVATFPPNTRYLDRFEEAQRGARGAGRGIWGLPEDEACGLTDRGNGIGGGCP